MCQGAYTLLLRIVFLSKAHRDEWMELTMPYPTRHDLRITASRSLTSRRPWVYARIFSECYAGATTGGVVD